MLSFRRGPFVSSGNFKVIRGTFALLLPTTYLPILSWDVTHGKREMTSYRRRPVSGIPSVLFAGTDRRHSIHFEDEDKRLPYERLLKICPRQTFSSPMFYSQFILAKKGPLGTIWIAAHLERKLRKAQVHDTNIPLSVGTSQTLFSR